MRPPSRLRARGIAAVLAWTGLAGSARADIPSDAKWRQGPLHEEYTVQQWLNGCGPAPQNGATGGGEIVVIRAEGDELAIVGGGRVFRTNQCWEQAQMPNLARETHSRDANGKTWRTRCTTAADDVRKAILNTLVVATSDRHIELVETGRYEVVLQSGRCLADVKRTRSYDLVDEKTDLAAVVPPPAIESAAPKAQRSGACDVPGEPRRLEVRPSQKLLRTGDSFRFRAVVLDEKGCATKTAATWKLADGARGVAVDATGNVTVAPDAREGNVDIVVSAAGNDAHVTAEITQPGHYDDLLALSGLNASGENEAASTASLGAQLGAGESQVEDRARVRRLWFLAIVGGVLALLALAAVFVARRNRRASALEREATARHGARVEDVLRRRKERAEAHAAQQRAHEESVAMRASVPVKEPPPSRACPTCGAVERAPTAFCPHDGTELVRMSSRGGLPIPAAIVRSLPKRGKICPTCGERFEGNADFCGRDGTQLVLIN